jgi:5-formyltetrahydrofolate cyclo-ligase
VVRRAVPKDARARRSAAIAAHVTAMPEWSQARCVAAYVAMRGEVDPKPIVTAAHAGGKTVALPRIDWGEEAMTFHVFVTGDALEESGMGFDQPPASSPSVELADMELVIVPAVAVDERGYRIGWGRGFYDRMLPVLPNATSIALVFDFQLLMEVPDTAGDVPVDVVASDRGILRIR